VQTKLARFYDWEVRVDKIFAKPVFHFVLLSIAAEGRLLRGSSPITMIEPTSLKREIDIAR